MSKDTWVARYVGCSAIEAPSRGTIYSGLAGIKNTSDYEVEVRKIEVELNDSVATLGSGITNETYKTIVGVSALAGGTSMTVAKMDPNASTLPSQVKVVRRPDSVTVTNTLRRMIQVPGMRPFPNAAALLTGQAFCQHYGAKGQSFFEVVGQRATGAIQPIVLREGEGILWRQLSSMGPHVQTGQVSFRVVATGATYFANTNNAATGYFDDCIAVFNGSGSGVVLEVFGFQTTDMGQNVLATGGTAFGDNAGYNQAEYGNTARAFMVADCKVMQCSDLLEGITVTPMPMDTSNPALPSGVSALREPYVVVKDGAQPLASQDEFIFAAMPPHAYQAQGVIRPVRVNQFERPGPGSTDVPFYRQAVRPIFDAGKGTGVIVKNRQACAFAYGFKSLLPGYWNNVADFAYGAPDYGTTWVNYTVSITFTITPGAGTPTYYAAAETHYLN